MGKSRILELSSFDRSNMDREVLYEVDGIAPGITGKFLLGLNSHVVVQNLPQRL